MKQTITIDGEGYEVDATVAGAIHEAAGEIDTLRSVLRRLAVIVGDEPCWCDCEELKHSKACRDAQQLKIWPRRKDGKPMVDVYARPPATAPRAAALRSGEK